MIRGLLTERISLEVLEVGFGCGHTLLELSWFFRDKSIRFHGVDKRPNVATMEDIVRLHWVTLGVSVLGSVGRKYVTDCVPFCPRHRRSQQADYRAGFGAQPSACDNEQARPSTVRCLVHAGASGNAADPRLRAWQRSQQQVISISFV